MFKMWTYPALDTVMVLRFRTNQYIHRSNCSKYPLKLDLRFNVLSTIIPLMFELQGDYSNIVNVRNFGTLRYNKLNFINKGCC